MEIETITLDEERIERFLNEFKGEVQPWTKDNLLEKQMFKGLFVTRQAAIEYLYKMDAGVLKREEYNDTGIMLRRVKEPKSGTIYTERSKEGFPGICYDYLCWLISSWVPKSDIDITQFKTPKPDK
jgi:hypothetical protein